VWNAIITVDTAGLEVKWALMKNNKSLPGLTIFLIPWIFPPKC